MKRLFCLPALAFMTAFSTSVSAVEYSNYVSDGIKQKMDVVFLKFLLEETEKGSPEAQYHLGFQYYYGLAAPKDYEMAAHWFRKAA